MSGECWSFPRSSAHRPLWRGGGWQAKWSPSGLHTLSALLKLHGGILPSTTLRHINHLRADVWVNSRQVSSCDMCSCRWEANPNVIIFKTFASLCFLGDNLCFQVLLFNNQIDLDTHFLEKKVNQSQQQRKSTFSPHDCDIKRPKADEPFTGNFPPTYNSHDVAILSCSQLPVV